MMTELNRCLLDKKVWGFSVSLVGMSLEFGDGKLNRRGMMKGEYSILAECSWELKRLGEVLATDERVDNQGIEGIFDGSSVEEMSISMEGVVTKIEFQGGIELLLRLDDQEQSWTLFRRSDEGKVGCNTISLKNIGDGSSNEVKWLDE